jgi:hypothetical protein
MTTMERRLDATAVVETLAVTTSKGTAMTRR